jgi:hypothetical protein
MLRPTLPAPGDSVVLVLLQQGHPGAAGEVLGAKEPEQVALAQEEMIIIP